MTQRGVQVQESTGLLGLKKCESQMEQVKRSEFGINNQDITARKVPNILHTSGTKGFVSDSLYTHIVHIASLFFIFFKYIWLL